MGLIDDVRPLSPRIKLAAQVLAAGLVVFGAHVRAGEVLGGLPSILLTMLWLVGICNSVNLMDNADGLCAGVVAIAAGFLAVSAMQVGQIFVPALAWVLAGSVLGFLLFNFPPARIFMGDAGSLPIGFLLGVATVLTTYYNPTLKTEPYGLAAPVFILAVPLYDTLTVLIHRYRAGVPLFQGRPAALFAPIASQGHVLGRDGPDDLPGDSDDGPVSPAAAVGGLGRRDPAGHPVCLRSERRGNPGKYGLP